MLILNRNVIDLMWWVGKYVAHTDTTITQLYTTERKIRFLCSFAWSCIHGMNKWLILMYAYDEYEGEFFFSLGTYTYNQRKYFVLFVTFRLRRMLWASFVSMYARVEWAQSNSFFFLLVSLPGWRNVKPKKTLNKNCCIDSKPNWQCEHREDRRNRLNHNLKYIVLDKRKRISRVLVKKNNVKNTENYWKIIFKYTTSAHVRKLIVFKW